MRSDTASLTLAFLIAITTGPAWAAEHTKDALGTVRERVEAKKAVLIDVREEHEWNTGHVKQAKLIPLSRLKTTKGVEEAVKSLPKGTPVYVHCKSGGRCLIAGKLFEKHGIDARPLKQGYGELIEAGFEEANE